jgi:phosphotransferase system enzyme I (PtsP)
MLDTLRRLIQEVNVARNLEQALTIIVQRIKQIIQADVCSVYLADSNNEHYVLMATEGLQPDAVGQIRRKAGRIIESG